MTIHLAEATIDEQDMDALADWIKGYPRLTKGKLTLEYEERSKISNKFGLFSGNPHVVPTRLLAA
jgi:hypothetical protein